MAGCYVRLFLQAIHQVAFSLAAAGSTRARLNFRSHLPPQTFCMPHGNFHRRCTSFNLHCAGSTRTRTSSSPRLQDTPCTFLHNHQLPLSTSINRHCAGSTRTRTSSSPACRTASTSTCGRWGAPAPSMPHWAAPLHRWGGLHCGLSSWFVQLASVKHWPAQMLWCA